MRGRFNTSGGSVRDNGSQLSENPAHTSFDQMIPSALFEVRCVADGHETFELIKYHLVGADVILH
jgi:hypothetical protein